MKRRVEQAVLRLRATRTALLTCAGLTSLTASFWTAFGLPAGLAAGGVSFLVLEFLSGEDTRR